MWQSVGLTLLVIVATLVCALLFMLFGEFKESNCYKNTGNLLPNLLCIDKVTGFG